MAFTLPDLPYAYDALEPHYDAKTVEIHHSKHHQTYTTKLNGAVEAAGLEGKSGEDILANLDDVEESKRGPVRNHGGGYWNHTFFWESMAPNANSDDRGPSGDLAKAIEGAFGSVDAFKEAFSAKAAWIPRVVELFSDSILFSFSNYLPFCSSNSPSCFSQSWSALLQPTIALASNLGAASAVRTPVSTRSNWNQRNSLFAGVSLSLSASW